MRSICLIGLNSVMPTTLQIPGSGEFATPSASNKRFQTHLLNASKRRRKKALETQNKGELGNFREPL